jgi:hypothetical protein
MPNKTKSNAGQPFDLAILYWFYKEPEVTKNHLQMIRRHNPGRKIYGLFGGQSERLSNTKNFSRSWTTSGFIQAPMAMTTTVSGFMAT